MSLLLYCLASILITSIPSNAEGLHYKNINCPTHFNIPLAFQRNDLLDRGWRYPNSSDNLSRFLVRSFRAAKAPGCASIGQAIDTWTAFVNHFGSPRGKW